MVGYSISEMTFLLRKTKYTVVETSSRYARSSRYMNEDSTACGVFVLDIRRRSWYLNDSCEKAYILVC